MDSDSHTLILTKGVYLMGARDAAEIRAALARGDVTAEVTLDLFGNVPGGQRTSIALAHVIAVTENVAPSATADGHGKLVPLRAKRRAASARAAAQV